VLCYNDYQEKYGGRREAEIFAKSNEEFLKQYIKLENGRHW